MMKVLLSFAIAFAIAVPANACAWIMGTRKDGTRVSTSRHMPSGRFKMRLMESAQTDLRVEGERMEKDLRAATSLAERNDYAVALMYLGRGSEAVELLKKLEAETPGKYETAANLGTAYELAGNNLEALRWIKEGIHRNEESHFGTEWLHFKILEAKLRQEKDPEYFKRNSVLNLDLSTIKNIDGHQSITLGGEPWFLEEITMAIDYQLVERLKFVKGKNPSVASLLFDYAALEAALNTLESAKALLVMAEEYGYPSDRIAPLLASYTRTIRWGGVREKAVMAPILLFLIALPWVWWRLRVSPKASKA
jgi:hypothetical protein